MKAKITAEVRAEIDALCADVLRIREKWAFVERNANNPDVDNATMMDAHADARAISSQITSRAFRIALLAIGERREKDA